MKSDFLNNLLDMFESTLEIAPLSADTDYKQHPAWSSLRALLLATAIEAEWDYLPTHSDFETNRTIADLANHLADKVYA